MSKQKLLMIINPLLALFLLNQAATGLLHNVLPHGVFEFMHKGGWILFILGIIHVFLNWGWVKSSLIPGGKVKGD
jgi:hypothetical protein